MKEEKLEYDIQKRARAGTAATARLAVALYLVYLGYKIIDNVTKGNTTMSPVIGWIAGLALIAAVVPFGVYIWKLYQRDLKAAKLPTESSQSDQP